MTPIDQRTKDRVLKMHSQGVRRPEIARALRLSKATICRILKKSC